MPDGYGDWTKEEVLEWAIKENIRATKVESKEEANMIRYRAKVIFDKRFPNPDICLTCGQKQGAA